MEPSTPPIQGEFASDDNRLNALLKNLPKEFWLPAQMAARALQQIPTLGIPPTTPRLSLEAWKENADWKALLLNVAAFIIGAALVGLLLF